MLRSVAIILLLIPLIAGCGGPVRPTPQPTISPRDGETDADGDGLPDTWEQSGIDFDQDTHVDLALHKGPYFANPWRKDIFVEIDYMEAHQPSDDALRAVERAFAQAPVGGNPDGTTGITLHLMLSDALPNQEQIDWGDFDAIKYDKEGKPCIGAFGLAEQRRDTSTCAMTLNAWRYVARYALIGDHLKGTASRSGIAEVPGNDLIMTLGGWPQENGLLKRVLVPWQQEIQWWEVEAGTLMHEIGHTLGLKHGGGTEQNCKPNYLSVMSYAHQFPIIGQPLDFSSFALPTLDKDALDESLGISGPEGGHSIYSDPDGEPRFALANAPIDWNGDGVRTDGLIRVQVNEIGDLNCDGKGPSQIDGFDDWSNLRYDFTNATDFADGIHESAEAAVEITFEQFTAFAESLEPADPLPAGQEPPSATVPPTTATVTSTDPPQPDGSQPAATSSPRGSTNATATSSASRATATSSASRATATSSASRATASITTTVPARPSTTTTTVTRTTGPIVTTTTQPPTDSDGDGIPDSTDNCPDDPNGDQANRDSDDLGDACDDDIDNDGLANADDNCPEIANTAQEDIDGDDEGDVCDDDRDGDDVANVSDNCPNIPNADQGQDRDRDGVGDACDDTRFLLILDRSNAEILANDVAWYLEDDGRIVYDLVDSLDVSDDGVVVTLEIVEGISLPDGTPLDSTYISDYLRDRASFELIEFEIDGFGGGIEQIDDYTIQIVLGNPDPDRFLVALTQYQFQIQFP